MSTRNLGTLTASRKLNESHSEMTPIGRIRPSFSVHSEAVEINSTQSKAAACQRSIYTPEKCTPRGPNYRSNRGFPNGFTAVAMSEERTYVKEKTRIFENVRFE